MSFVNFWKKNNKVVELDKSEQAVTSNCESQKSTTQSKPCAESVEEPQRSVKHANIERKELDKQLNDLELRALAIQKIVDEQKLLLSDVFNEITAIKMSIAQCMIEYKDDDDRGITQEKIEDNIPTSEDNFTPVEAKIPKKLQIRDHYSVYDNVKINFNKLIGYSDYLYTRIKISSTTRDVIPSLAWDLSDAKKEIILVKTEYKFSDEKLEELGTIISTCEKIAELKKQGDSMGYKKYLSFFSQKYPIPADPFTDEEPTDYFSGVDSPPYVTAFHLRYLMKRLCPIILENRDTSWRSYLNRYKEVVISDEYVSLLKTIADLLLRGYTIGIVPILDENILYRPQSAAQDENCLSFLY